MDCRHRRSNGTECRLCARSLGDDTPLTRGAQQPTRQPLAFSFVGDTGLPSQRIHHGGQCVNDKSSRRQAKSIPAHGGADDRACSAQSPRSHLCILCPPQGTSLRKLLLAVGRCDNAPRTTRQRSTFFFPPQIELARMNRGTIREIDDRNNANKV